MMSGLLVPSYQNGFARSAGETENPQAWDGVVGLWAPFLGPTGSTLFDQSGYSNNGTLTDMEPAADWVAGNNPRLPAWALDFDGVDEYVAVPDTDRLSFGNAVTDLPFSVTACVKMDDATKFRICCKGDDATALIEWAFITQGDDTLGLFLYDNGAGNQIRAISDAAVTGDEDVWTHFGASYDGSGVNAGITLYRNGQVLASTGGDVGAYTAMHNLAVGFYIGAFLPLDDGGNESFANGQISSAAVYNRVRTAVEFQHDFDDPAAMFTLRRRMFPTAVAGTAVDELMAAMQFDDNLPIRPQLEAVPY